MLRCLSFSFSMVLWMNLRSSSVSVSNLRTQVRLWRKLRIGKYECAIQTMTDNKYTWELVYRTCVRVIQTMTDNKYTWELVYRTCVRACVCERMYMCARVYIRVCVRECVRACVSAWVRAYMRAHVLGVRVCICPLTTNHCPPASHLNKHKQNRSVRRSKNMTYQTIHHCTAALNPLCRSHAPFYPF